MRAGLLAVDGGRPTRASYLVFGQPVIGDEEIDEVVDSLRRRWLGTGPKVHRFEEMIRDHVGAPYVRCLNSCTAGLQLALLCAGVGPGDEVITTTFTFAATVNVIVHSGATPVLVDVDRSTQNIVPEQIEAAITPRTKVIIPVHMAGRPCDMEAIADIAKRHGLIVIEDSGARIGAEYHGDQIGSLSDATVFSFYATKNIATGEGGAVATLHEDWASKIEIYGLHGLSAGAWERYTDEGFRHYGVVLPGFKFNMMDLQAAIGLHQFPRLVPWLRRREAIWKRYDEAFAELPVETPTEAEADTVHARHLYTLLLDLRRLEISRDQVQAALHAENIGTGIHFVATHLHPWYRDNMPWTAADFPVACRLSAETISLPMSPGLTDEDVDDVIWAVTKVLRWATSPRIF